MRLAGQKAGPDGSRVRASSVLVAVTGESCDAAVVRLACQLLNSNKGKVHILFVIEVERAFPVDAEVTLATAKGEKVLKAMEEVAKASKCVSEGELVQARQVGSAVVQEAFDRNVETIVLGLTYNQSYGSFTMGDVVPYVLKNAPCRVIVWRDPVNEAITNGHPA